MNTTGTMFPLMFQRVVWIQLLKTFSMKGAYAHPCPAHVAARVDGLVCHTFWMGIRQHRLHASCSMCCIFQLLRAINPFLNEKPVCTSISYTPGQVAIPAWCG